MFVIALRKIYRINHYAISHFKLNISEMKPSYPIYLTIIILCLLDKNSELNLHTFKPDTYGGKKICLSRVNISLSKYFRNFLLICVVLMLLILAGIEQNPGPRMSKQTTLETSLDRDKEIKDLINALTKRLDNWGERLESRLSAIDDRVENINQRLQQLEESSAVTKAALSQNSKKIKDLEDQLEYLDAKSRERNLIFYGIEQDINEDCRERIRRVIEENMRTTEKINITRCHRVSRKPGAPILVEVPEQNDRTTLFKAAFNLRGTKISLSKDYSMKMREQRRVLNVKRRELVEKERGSSVLDYFMYTHGLTQIISDMWIEELSYSDHLPIVLQINTGYEAIKSSYKNEILTRKFIWTKENVEMLKHNLSDIEVGNETDINTETANFTKQIYTAMESANIIKFAKRRHQLSKPWYDKDCYIMKQTTKLCRLPPRLHGRVDIEVRLASVKEGITEESIDREWQECDKYEEEKLDIQQKVSVLRNPDKEETIPIASEDTVINVKLPELALKSYDGSLEGWLPWWAQFSKIHENKNLSDSDRFLYLRQAIVPNSEAYRVVASYPVTGANYVLAVQALQERFGDPNILTELYVRRLLNSVISNVKKENRNLSSLYDELSSHLRSLETLGIDPQLSGIFLYPLVESSLPSDILKIWHRHPSSGYGMELAKREESDKGVGGAQERLRLLLDFLKAEVRSAQRLKFVEKGFKQEEPYKRSYNDGTRTRSNFRPATVSSLFGGRTNIKCFFCERTNHASHQCRSIMKMSPGERNDKIRSAHLCFKCLRKGHIQSQCREQLECKNCGRNHLEVLCEGNSSNRLTKPGRENLKENATEPIASLSSQACTGQVLLMTTVALLRGPNASRRVRILLDSGSQFSYIKQSLVWSIGIERKGEITIAKSLFGGNKIGEEKHGKFMLELENLGNKRDVIHIEALDQRKICDAIPPLPKGDWLEKLKIKGIILSQDNFKGQEIDILIGANYLGMILTGKIVQVEADLTAVETKLGWTLMGNSPIIDSNDNVQQTLNLLTTRCDLKDLWDLEVLGIRDPVETCSKETRYQEIKEKFITKIQRLSDQRFSVGLPWKVEKESIPSNLDIAIKRLDISTKKMTSQNKLTEYSQIFRDWLTEGLIERVKENPLERRGYYLPHRPVYKMESKTTPIRPVFDASCLGHNGLSLNQCLEKGPNLLERIPEMMVRFRENKFGVTADIRKAFQMVAIEESERNYLRFLWWEKESDRELIAYRHKRLVFGLNCSPFVLNAVIEYHLQSIRGPLVQWAKILAQSFYMDNCITSLETKQEVQEFQKAAIEIMDRAKMDLREWEYSLEENPEKGTCTKILGVVWNKMEDSLKCELPDNLSIQPKLTKRLVLSMVQRIFDPLGFCAPVFLTPKLLLQRSWGLKLGWDTPLPESLAQEFRTWLDQIKFIELIKIPRYMWNDLIFPTEVHIFCDASQIGYGAVAYLRSETGRENTLTLIWSKVRLAPMKSITIPRLELMAMVLGARLAHAIQAALKRKCEKTLWSDSTTALSWIKREIEWRVFVRNRVREIQATTNLNDWRFVPSQLNPADLLSRGCPPSQFVQSRWWEGPEWLKKPKEFWPNSEFSINPKEIKVEKNNDLKPLTPNEFLQNGPEASFPEFENLKPEMLHTRYRELGQLKRELKQRFLKEYLGALIQKSENIDRRQLKVGDVVLIGQENLKRMFWPKGRIVNLIPEQNFVGEC
ncbi:hypothetical protein LAZ67_20001600 [Cordylochernes scorpioides]|uniref:CCHC-type domain-containing protein n=1 Tax=Cordylochernes scorpioides TaxID=51811 RepID=A0ABY6LK46_9ARAC|nr:hypothetical protein LAZ67_20001600 [Cordylochernes scorpioides]